MTQNLTNNITSSNNSSAAQRGTNERKVLSVIKGARFHMVGDGFRVTNYFPAGDAIDKKMSRFFLMDYHPPFAYAPTDKPRGVGSHPHRGFETVSIAWEGSVAHHDSAGNSGVIGPGDVQWMTAGGGILHKEYHEKNFAKVGGTMHMMQLWVNLPAKDKFAPPAYQDITADRMGIYPISNDGGTVRIIAGEINGIKGPARTFTPINLWDVRLNKGASWTLPIDSQHNLGVLVINGTISVNGQTRAENRDLVVFNDEGEKVTLSAEQDTHLLILSGQPIREPVAAYGPFVMNTPQQIQEAISDFRSGKFGYLE